MKAENGTELNLIAAGTVFEGKLRTNGSIRIDGKIVGEVTAAQNISLGSTGDVEGNITAKSVTIGGKIRGAIVAQDKLVFESKAVVRGDIRDQSLLERTLGEYEIRTVFHLAAQTIVGVANRRSISWAIAQAVAAQGARLAVTYQSDRLGENVRELTSALADPVVAPCDLSDDQQIAALADSVDREFGGLDARITLGHGKPAVGHQAAQQDLGKGRGIAAAARAQVTHGISSRRAAPCGCA